MEELSSFLNQLTLEKKGETRFIVMNNDINFLDGVCFIDKALKFMNPFKSIIYDTTYENHNEVKTYSPSLYSYTTLLNTFFYDINILDLKIVSSEYYVSDKDDYNYQIQLTEDCKIEDVNDYFDIINKDELFVMLLELYNKNNYDLYTFRHSLVISDLNKKNYIDILSIMQYIYFNDTKLDYYRIKEIEQKQEQLIFVIPDIIYKECLKNNISEIFATSLKNYNKNYFYNEKINYINNFYNYYINPSLNIKFYIKVEENIDIVLLYTRFYKIKDNETYKINLNHYDYLTNFNTIEYENTLDIQSYHI